MNKNKKRNCYRCTLNIHRHIQGENPITVQNTNYCARMGNSKNADPLEKEFMEKEHPECFFSPDLTPEDYTSPQQ